MNVFNSMICIVAMGAALLFGSGCEKHDETASGHEHGAACSHGAGTATADGRAEEEHAAEPKTAGTAKTEPEASHEHGAACSHGGDTAAADGHAEADHAAEPQTAGTAKAESETGHEHGAACSHDTATADGHAEEDHAAEPKAAGTAKAEPEPGHQHGAACSQSETASPDTVNRASPAITVPENARKLIGLTCVTAVKRNIRGSVRFPGSFELMPGARRVYGTASPGVVEVCVLPFQRVRKGDTLFRVASPEWARQTGAKREAAAALALAKTEAEALRERLLKLKETGVRNAELEMTLKMKEAEAARSESVFQSVEGQLRSVLALCREESGFLVFEARDGGVVERVSTDSGAWLDAGSEVVSVAREDGIWFRANGAPAEMLRIRDGLPGYIEPLRGTADTAGHVEGVVSLGWIADATARVRPVYLTPKHLPPWATPGSAGILSMVTEQSASESLAVPLACVVPDGLRSVVFVRDVKNHNAFTKNEVVLGASDGDWVEVQGIAAGASVVLNGAYELKLTAPSASSAAPKKAGHFHADGQFYEDSH